MEADLYLGAFNYLGVPQFLQKVFTQPWKCPGEVQVFLKEQHENKWRLIDLSNFEEYSAGE